jgi:hypothetical protein
MGRTIYEPHRSRRKKKMRRQGYLQRAERVSKLDSSHKISCFAGILESRTCAARSGCPLLPPARCAKPGRGNPRPFFLRLRAQILLNAPRFFLALRRHALSFGFPHSLWCVWGEPVAVRDSSPCVARPDAPSENFSSSVSALARKRIKLATSSHTGCPLLVCRYRYMRMPSTFQPNALRHPPNL